MPLESHIADITYADFLNYAKTQDAASKFGGTLETFAELLAHYCKSEPQPPTSMKSPGTKPIDLVNFIKQRL